MASASTTETFKCSPEQFFSIITNYESYPDFLPEVNKCEVIEENGNCKLVEFEISVVKNFTYRLWMKETEPTELSWVFDSGDLFKVSTGKWTLSSVEGGAQASYNLEAKFKIFVPGPIAKTIINVNLPNMIQAYHQRVTSLF